MNPKTKACVSFVSLIIGMFLLLEGSRITFSGREVWIDLVLIVVGAVLAVAYLPLIGNYLELKLSAPRMVTLMPMLLVLGAVLVYQGIIRPLSMIEKPLFVVLGAVLVAASAVVIGKAAKKRR